MIPTLSFSLATPTTDTVKPGNKLTIKVDFAPMDNTTYTGTLDISSNAGADVSIDLSGTGSNVKMLSEIETDSTSLNFGQVSRSDYSKDLQFTITNKGNASLLVDSVRIRADKGIFILANSIPPDGIDRNSSYIIIVTFMPQENKIYTGEVDIYSNADNAKNVTIALQGEGTKFPPSAVTDNAGNIMSLTAAPNPVNDLLNIKYNLSATGINSVNLKIYDIQGTEVYSRFLGEQFAGQQSLDLNCSNFASGFYFIELTSGINRARVPMIIVH